MTQYLLSVPESRERDDLPTPSQEGHEETYARVGAFNTRLQEAGAWVFAGGLGAPSTATVVDGTGDEVVLTDGPFVEAKECIGGFWVVEAADLDEALRWAAEGSAACGSPVEARPLMGE